jgi:hypothetical protein
VTGHLEENNCCVAPSCAPNVFFDTEKGWMRFWNPKMSFGQLAQRTRNSSFYAFDCFRALAFLWVCLTSKNGC